MILNISDLPSTRTRMYRFSQNLSLFRRDVNETLKQANLGATNANSTSGGSSSMNDMIVS